MLFVVNVKAHIHVGVEHATVQSDEAAQIGSIWRGPPTLNPNVAPPSPTMSPRQNLPSYLCQFRPGQTGKSRRGWRHWTKQNHKSCGAILAKDRCDVGKTLILIIAASQLCITRLRGLMMYFADISCRLKMIAMQNCAEDCAGCTI